MEFPKTTFDWAIISEVLEQRGQLTMILDKVQEKQRQKNITNSAQVKRINPEELPEPLTVEAIDILAHMANEIPQSEEWHQIFSLLSHEDLRRVMDKRIEIQDEIHRQKRAVMTEEEKQKEKAWWDNRAKNPNPDEFFGNMGQPETPEQFKNRYGVYPFGYDENGNKIEQ